MHQGHRERLRKRFVRDCDSFENHELLELLLGYAIPRKDVNNLAHTLISRFGSLSSVLEAPPEILKQIDGIGEYSSVLINMVPVIFRAYLKDKHYPAKKMLSLKQIADMLMHKFFGRRDEHIALVFLDAKKRLKFCEIIAYGSVNSAGIYTQKLAELIVNYRPRYAIIAHNHPSGIALPSKNDIKTTVHLADFFKKFGVILLDHLIFCDDDYVSLASSELWDTIFSNGNKEQRNIS